MYITVFESIVTSVFRHEGRELFFPRKCLIFAFYFD